MAQKESSKQFIIKPPAKDARQWAQEFWDTYGFDYDKERSTADVVYAWPLEPVTEEQLGEKLAEDKIDFSSHAVDWDAWFNVTL